MFKIVFLFMTLVGSPPQPKVVADFVVEKPFASEQECIDALKSDEAKAYAMEVGQQVQTKVGDVKIAVVGGTCKRVDEEPTKVPGEKL